MRQQNTSNSIELWRWRMVILVADYINQPDDMTMTDLTELIQDYRNYHDLKKHISTNLS